MTNARWALPLALLAASAGSAPAQQACRPAELVTVFGDWKALTVPLRATESERVQTIAPHNINDQPASSLRLLLSAPQPGHTPWSLAIRDAAGHLVAQIERRDFVAVGATVWTGRLPGPAVTIALRGGDADTQIMLRGASVRGPDGSDQHAFSLDGPQPTWRGVYDVRPSHELSDAAEAVGILVDNTLSPGPDGELGQRESWCCSGVMIASDLFLTNWHCAGTGLSWTSDVRGNAIIDLGWDGGSVRRQFSAKEVVSSDAALDFAILRIQAAAGTDGAIRSTYPVRISTAPLHVGDKIYLIHHAQCQPKLISDNCKVQSTDHAPWPNPLSESAGGTTEITHNCDTEPGASGGPVFNPEGELVALHHLGHQKTATATCPADHANKAVKIADIAAFVRKNNKPLFHQLGW